MKRSLRRWLTLCFAIVTIMTVSLSYLWSYLDAKSEANRQQQTQAIACFELTKKLLVSLSPQSLRSPKTIENYEELRNTIRNYCQAFALDYLYLYTVSESRDSIQYVFCVSSSDDSDSIVKSLRGVGTTVHVSLTSSEHAVLDGTLPYVCTQINNEYGSELTWTFPWTDENNQAFGLICLDYSAKLTHQQIFQQMIRKALPVVLSMVLSYLVLLYLMTEQLIRPIRILSTRMNTFVADRDKPLKTPNIRSFGEISEISCSFEKMRTDMND